MRIVVTGSIANDYLMDFPGRFTEQLIAERVDKVSLSFLVDDLEIRKGGVAANISFGLGQLGLVPVLVGAVGSDFEDYRRWLEDNGVDTSSVHVSKSRYTARFVCTTDADQNQIASFYAGAMAEAREIGLESVVERAGDIGLVVVAPNDPAAMVRHTDDCRRLGLPFVADPSQQLARMEGPEIRSLVHGAEVLFTNDYESDLLLAKTGWSRADVLSRVGLWITTLGDQGARVESAGAETIEVPAVRTDREVDPTGLGDAFRAGYLAAVSAGMAPVRGVQLGCAVATVALEHRGCQEYRLDPDALLARIERTYDAVATAELEAVVRSAGQVARLSGELA